MISVLELREMEQGNKTFSSKLHFTIIGIGKIPARPSATHRYSLRNHTAFFQPQHPADKKQIESQNPSVVWVGRSLKCVPYHPLPWAGTPATIPGVSKLHPAWMQDLPSQSSPKLMPENSLPICTDSPVPTSKSHL